MWSLKGLRGSSVSLWALCFVLRPRSRASPSSSDPGVEEIFQLEDFCCVCMYLFVVTWLTVDLHADVLGDVLQDERAQAPGALLEELGLELRMLSVTFTMVRWR